MRLAPSAHSWRAVGSFWRGKASWRVLDQGRTMAEQLPDTLTEVTADPDLIGVLCRPAVRASHRRLGPH